MPTRPRRSCGSWTPSRTTTTSRTSTPTSTSPTPSCSRSRPDVAVAVGDQAPDFTLPGTGDRDYHLADYRGQTVVLVFYPGDETPVCTKQLTTYSDDISSFRSLGAQVLAISAQDVASHERFST